MKIISAACIAALFAAPCLSAAKPANLKRGGVKISVSGALSAKTGKALALLGKSAPEAGAQVKKYVFEIKKGALSGISPENAPNAVALSTAAAGCSVTWLAGAIAHESCLLKLYADYGKSHEGPVPRRVWTGGEADRYCIRYQLSVLRQLNAPQQETDCLSSGAGNNSGAASSYAGWESRCTSNR
ncbi:MAG: hypothetical protein PHP45_00470 [Elusimicrobiales bacterium]|nr:hypothetical protein [Elusimicrobiales bacterium]